MSILKEHMFNYAATLQNIKWPYYHNYIKMICKFAKESKNFYDLLKTDKSLIWFQYKIYLHKIKSSTPTTCGLCRENEETLHHLFVSCEESSHFWSDIKVQIKQVLKVEIITILI